MLTYVFKRLLYILAVFLILSFIIFMIYNLIPGDKAAEEARAEVAANRNLNYSERYQFWRERYGLDAPIPVRYLRWIGVVSYSDGSYRGLLQGNLGTSKRYSRPVGEVLSEPMKNTVTINLISTILSLLITIPLGMLSALKRGRAPDTGIRVFTVVGYSLPVFIIAIVAIWIFSVKLGIFPVSGMESAGAPEWGVGRRILDRLYHLALPVLVMTFASLGGMTRYVRASVAEALSLDCIRTAKAKGLSPRRVLIGHAWRCALVPIVTLLIGWFLSIFSGSLMIENIFSLNGVGRVYYDALVGKDNDVVLALQMFYIAIALVGNLLTDLAYGAVDPRIRVGE